jgi:hypothetical protein
MPTYEPSPAATAFGAFLTEHGLSDPEAGRLLKVTVVTIYHWRIGLKIPKPIARRKIQKWTSHVYADGSLAKPGIPTADWDGGQEERELAEIRPYVVLADAPKKRRSSRRKPARIVKSEPAGEAPDHEEPPVSSKRVPGGKRASHTAAASPQARKAS